MTMTTWDCLETGKAPDVSRIGRSQLCQRPGRTASREIVVSRDAKAGRTQCASEIHCGCGICRRHNTPPQNSAAESNSMCVFIIL